VGKNISYNIYVGNPEGKRPLGRPRRKSVHNINKDGIRWGWNGVNNVAQDREQWRALVIAVMNIDVP
jgi:hypothetical protein